MQAASLALPGVTLDGVHALAWTGQDGRPHLQLQATKAAVPALGWRGVALDITGEPQRGEGGAWKFVGHVATVHAPGGALSDADVTLLYNPAAETMAVDVVQGKSELHALMPLDQTTHVQMMLKALPLGWIRGVLATAWPQGRLNGGSVSGTVALDLAAAGTRVSGRVDVTGADLDSKAGNIAAKNLGADGSFRIDTGVASTSMMFDGSLHGGQMLLGPLYAQLPAHPVNVHVAGNFGVTGIRISSLDFEDPDALRVAGTLGFNARGDLDELDLKQLAATFPAAYTRYGTSLFRSLAGVKQLDVAGNVMGSLRMNGKGFQAFDLQAQDFSLGSKGNSLSVTDLTGKVDWRAGASRPATSLGWKSLSMYRIAFGPAKLNLEDQAGALTLRKPVQVAVLGGSFGLDHFTWRPDAGKSQRLAAGFAVTDVDLPELCKAFGWPAFGGKLGGAVPDLSYRGDELVFSGGLSLNVFGGSISVTRLRMQHLFGAAPKLAADIGMNQLDMAQVTSVFDFGKITGNLDGSVQGLKLVDWKPVAFDASLSANGGTISQNAIQSLTSLGGGGIAGGLQGIALRLFKTFHYARIGLGCTLEQGVCTMRGISPDPNPSGDGYTIVEGSGLPRITVIGHERKVDWATLVSRLKSATEGNGPVVK